MNIPKGIEVNDWDYLLENLPEILKKIKKEVKKDETKISGKGEILQTRVEENSRIPGDTPREWQKA